MRRRVVTTQYATQDTGAYCKSEMTAKGCKSKRKVSTTPHTTALSYSNVGIVDTEIRKYRISVCATVSFLLMK